MSGIRGGYFDGQTSRRREGWLALEEGVLVLTVDDTRRAIPPGDLDVSEPDAGGLRVLRLRGGGTFEVEDREALRALLAASGQRDSEVVRLQSSWPVVVVALVLLVAGTVVAYHSGLPWLAERIAKALPDAAHAQIGDRTLALLDRVGFAASDLPAERQAQLDARFAALQPPDGVTPPHAIHFRAGGPFGANAFALPNGDVIVTDELVALAEDDDEILAVLAHELGHVRERHGLRTFLQGTAVGIAVALFFGDVSTVLAGVPAFLLETKYSRDFERQADAYAAAMLRANDIPAARLGAILQRLEAAASGAAAADEEEEAAEPRPRSSLSRYLSSHPLTEERLEALGER